MILEEATKEAFGHYPSKLKPHSNKLVISICECCGNIRVVQKNLHRFLCGSCSCFFTCQNRGKNNPNFGKHISKGQREKQRASMKGNKNPNFGKEMLKAEKSPYYKGGRRATDVRSRAKRRGLGHTLICPVEEGEDEHHFTNEHIGGIPADIHNSIGGRRKKHRTIVLQWLKIHDKKKYNKVLCVLAKQ